MAEVIAERVSELEENLNRFIIHTDKALYRLERGIDTLRTEMQEFKNEMKEFKDEMKEFKDEMKEYKVTAEKEIRQFKQDMNKKWGDLTNKLGSFAEDIAAPNIPRIAREYFHAGEIRRYMPNLRIQHPARSDEDYEFDAVVLTEKMVFLLDTKYTVREKYVENIPKIIRNFHECLPEYNHLELITIFASMQIHENTLKKLTRMGIYAMAMGDDTMDLLNFEAIQKKQKKS
jgi:chromosome segregation ATPase